MAGGELQFEVPQYSSGSGQQYYYIQTDSAQQAGGEQFIVKDISELGEDAIIMFEEGGVGAEEVVSSDDYVTCVVDSSQMAGLSSYPGAGLGVVEEEVATEVIKTEIHTDGEVHYQIKSEVEYEEGDIQGSSVFLGGAGKSSYEQPLNLVKKKISPTKITRMLSTGGGTLNTATDLVICKLCNSYVVAAKIDTHNRDMHSSVDRLTCPDCGKLFTSKRSLVGHKKEKHSGMLEIFPCAECGKNFSRKSNLKAHMDSIHYGKKFPCSFCERIFTNRSCMNLHVKKTHSDVLSSL